MTGVQTCALPILTTRVEALEKQQDEILSALEEAAKAQEEAKKKAEEEAKNQKAQVEETSSGDASEDAKKDEENTDETEAEDTSSNEDSEELVYKNGTYTGDGQGLDVYKRQIRNYRLKGRRYNSNPDYCT